MDNDLQSKTGLPSSPSAPAKMFRDVYGIYESLFNPDVEKFFTPAKNDQERSGKTKPYIEYYDPATGKVVKHN